MCPNFLIATFRHQTRVADALQPGTRTLLTEIDISIPMASDARDHCMIELHIPRKTPSLWCRPMRIIFRTAMEM